MLIDSVFELASRDAALLVELDLKLVCTLETHVHADHVTAASMMKRRFGSAIAVPADSGIKGADRYLARGDRVEFGSRYLKVRPTPGHTRACLTYVLDDESIAFTGDCLLIRGSGRTDFQQGDAGAMYRSVAFAALQSRWHVVPAGVWHRTVAPGVQNWAIVAFHSAQQVNDELRDLEN